MTRFSYSFSPVVGTLRLPLVPASLVVGGVASPRMTALVDTGASYTLVKSEIVERLTKLDRAGLRKIATNVRPLAGLGGDSVGLQVPIDKLLLWKGTESLELASPVVLCVSSLPFEMLIGQRCGLEKLFLVHRSRHDQFVIGHATAFRT